jgi:hypothetical protein
LISSKPAGQGSGLGLSIVHAIVHQLGGHIALNAPGGSFSTCIVMLPAVQLEISGSLISTKAATRNVLIVESDMRIANHFHQNTRLHRMHVNRVSSVDAAAVILQQRDKPLDAVLIGNMPSPIDIVSVASMAHSGARPDLQVILYARQSLQSVVARLETIDVFLNEPIDDDILPGLLLRQKVA